MSLLETAYDFARCVAVASGGFEEADEAFRATEDMFRRKYRHWRGRSGRSYVFSVYAPLDCPAYENTVLVVATRGRADRLACVDLGPFPESRLSRMRQRFAGMLDEVEFHIHVLAERETDRFSVISDVTALGV